MKRFFLETAVVSQGGAMEADTIRKNGTNLRWIKIALFIVSMFCSNNVYSQLSEAYYIVADKWNSLKDANTQINAKEAPSSMRIFSLRNESGYFCVIGGIYATEEQATRSLSTYKNRYTNAYVKKIKTSDIAFENRKETAEKTTTNTNKSTSQTQIRQSNGKKISKGNVSLILIEERDKDIVIRINNNSSACVLVTISYPGYNFAPKGLQMPAWCSRVYYYDKLDQTSLRFSDLQIEKVENKALMSCECNAYHGEILTKN